jgi:hypothetical protein
MDVLPPQKKKGLGALGWMGVGCGGIVGLCVIAFVVFFLTMGGKEWLKEAQENPTRAAATSMVKFTGGKFEMVAEDDVAKRYTVREKKSGQLVTVYWSKKANKALSIPGDFSAIPADEGASDAPVPAPAPAPSPAPER